MKVNELLIKTEKKIPPVHKDNVTLLVGHGVKGDVFAKGGDREVIILSQSTIQKILKYKDEGLCIKRFSGNIILSEIDLNKVKKGSILKIGETCVIVTKLGKRCFPDCELIKRKKICALSKEVIFAKVLKTGIIFINDNVEIKGDK